MCRYNNGEGAEIAGNLVEYLIYNSVFRCLISGSVSAVRSQVRQGERGNGVPGLTTLAVSTLIEVS